jgi:O-antigen/teichoic acid export membrane protein
LALLEPNSELIVRDEQQGQHGPTMVPVGVLDCYRDTVLQKLIRWASKGGFAILDQGLISGSNFLVSILLGRWLMPDQYGVYAVAFATSVLLMIVYQALVLEPMAVFGGSCYRNNLRSYLRSLLWIHFGLSLAIVVVLAVSAAIIHRLAVSSGLPGALAGLTLALPWMQLFWLARRSFYLELSPKQAASGSLLYSILVLAGLYLVNRGGLLSPFSAFLLMGFGAAGAAVVMLQRLRTDLRRGGLRLRSRELWSKHWSYGRWALAGSIAGWIPTYAYYPLLSSFASMTQSGEFRALMNFTLPVEQTKAALSMLFLPYVASRYEREGKSSARILGRRITLGTVGGTLLYWAAIIPIRSSVFHFLYSGRYREVTYLLPIVALGSIFASGSSGPAIALRAMESPYSVFSAFAIATLLSLLVGVAATWAFGLTGALWGSVLADIFTFVTVSLLFRRKVDQLN